MCVFKVVLNEMCGLKPVFYIFFIHYICIPKVGYWFYEIFTWEFFSSFGHGTTFFSDLTYIGVPRGVQNGSK